MTNLTIKVLELFSAHSALSSVHGPFVDEAPVDQTEPDEVGGDEPEWCVFSESDGETMTYLSSETDRKAPSAITFELYTTTRGRERTMADALRSLFDQTYFDFTDGRCEWSRVASSQVGYVGTNARGKRLYRATVAVTFDCHSIPS